MRRLPCGDDHPCYFQFPGHDGLQPGESYLVRMLNGPARNIAVTPATPVPLVFTRQRYRQRNVEVNVIHSCLVLSVEPPICRRLVCCLAQIETHAAALL